MKMLAYAVGEEERPYFRQYQEQYDVELTMTKYRPSLLNLEMARGMDCINVLSETVITPEMWDGFHKMGVRAAVTRCVGMEHMNQAYAENLGIAVMNVCYSPASVADYAIMMMLMVLRNIKPILQRYVGQDYTVKGLRGRELPNMSVGLIGAGRIGCTVARHLSGFGCRIHYWNRSPKAEMEGVAEYCTLDELLTQSDLVSLHLTSNDETFHFMDSEKLGKMKPGGVLINTARGALVDSGALIDALERGHLSGAGLDVFDGDRNIYYSDYKNRLIGNRDMAVLNAMPNVLMLPHMAYYTDQAISDMVHNSMVVTSEYFRGLTER